MILDTKTLLEKARSLAADFIKWASECPPKSRENGLHLTREEQETIASLLNDLAFKLEHTEKHVQMFSDKAKQERNVADTYLIDKIALQNQLKDRNETIKNLKEQIKVLKEQQK